MLKPLLEITVPDTRWQHFACGDVFQSMTLETHFADIQSLALAGSAPADVIIVWERMRNTYLLAWYCYDLVSAAVPQAFMGLELAGRIRLGLGANARHGLHSIIDSLVSQGVLTERFRHPMTLAKTAAGLRNHWQHGTADVADPNHTLTAMRFCKDLIEAMYP